MVDGRAPKLRVQAGRGAGASCSRELGGRWRVKRRYLELPDWD